MDGGSGNGGSFIDQAAQNKLYVLPQLARYGQHFPSMQFDFLQIATVCVVSSHMRIALPKKIEVKHTISFEPPY